MITEINKNLKDRDSERKIKLFTNSNHYLINFISLSTENGVIRNGGRRGSTFAPKALLNIFKKTAITNNESRFNEVECANNQFELENFNRAQIKESEDIYNVLCTTSADYHIALGGGHDHIFPLLTAISKKFPNKKMRIVNIDPHLDMRIDDVNNSGTPFRQFDLKSNIAHELIQIGTLDYTNVNSSKLNTKNINQKIININLLKNETNNFTSNIPFLNRFLNFDDQFVYVLSIDIDCLISSEMEAVSAVNFDGVPLNFVKDTIKYFKNNLNCQYYGIFEYNPIYDNLSQKGARNIVSLFEALDS